jgi:hypothetical protein
MRALPPDPERTARLGVANRPPAPPELRWVLLAWLLSTSTALLPIQLRRLLSGRHRSARSRLRRLGLHLAALAGIDWVMRWMARQTIERRELEERLREELGRPPWPGEVEDAWAEQKGFPPLR